MAEVVFWAHRRYRTPKPGWLRFLEEHGTNYYDLVDVLDRQYHARFDGEHFIIFDSEADRMAFLMRYG